MARFYAAFAARAKHGARRTAETAHRLSHRRDAVRRGTRHRAAVRRAASMSRYGNGYWYVGLYL